MMPMSVTVDSEARKPPTLTMPVALPSRVGGLNVRARSKPTSDPGPPTAVTTTSTTSSGSGARPGQSRTTAQTVMIAKTTPRMSVDRENGYLVTNPPISGLDTTVVTVINISSVPAVDGES